MTRARNGTQRDMAPTPSPQHAERPARIPPGRAADYCKPRPAAASCHGRPGTPHSNTRYSSGATDVATPACARLAYPWNGDALAGPTRYPRGTDFDWTRVHFRRLARQA